MGMITDKDRFWLSIAFKIGSRSKAIKRHVGAIIVMDDRPISIGYNGTPKGWDNTCETRLPDGTMETKPEVLHAESNAIAFLARRGSVGAKGTTIYVSYPPCLECAKLIHQAGISRVVCARETKTPAGIQFLKKAKILIVHVKDW